MQVLDELLDLLAGLVAELLLGRCENLLQNRDDLGGQTLDDWVLGLVEGDNHLEDGLVLLVVLTERKELDEHRQDLVDRDVVGVGLDHASDTSGRVVQKTSFLLLVEQRLELCEDGVVVSENLLLVGALFAEKTGSVGSVTANFRVFVSEALKQHLHQCGGVRGDGCAHVANALGEGTDGGATLVLLLAGSVLEASLLENLVELTEGVTKGGGKACDDLHGGLDNKPVVLGRLHLDILGVLAIEVLLADVLLLENGDDVLGDLLDCRSSVLAKVGGKEGGTTKLQGGGNVAVDVGDAAPVIVLSVIEKEQKV